MRTLLADCARRTALARASVLLACVSGCTVLVIGLVASSILRFRSWRPAR